MRSGFLVCVGRRGETCSRHRALGGYRTILHALGTGRRYSELERFEVDGANAAGCFERSGHSAHQIPIVWEPLRLHKTVPLLSQRARGRDDAFRNPSWTDWAGLEMIPTRQASRQFARSSSACRGKSNSADCLAGVVRRKAANSYDNSSESVRGMWRRYTAQRCRSLRKAPFPE